jgi:hypothetical protein
MIQRAELHLALLAIHAHVHAMRWKQQDANELGDQEWVPTGPNPIGVTIFYDDQEQEFVVVTEDGDHLGSAKTMAEAQEIAENFGYPLPDKPPAPK